MKGIDGVRKYIGVFATEIEAARAYDAACIAAGEVPQNAAHGLLTDSGRMPQPFNASAAKGYRWALSTIEAYEQQAVAS